ncbi:MAG: hydrogenase maturation nickel metallochaperone HypA [Anaeromyxobacteraceae bacterium]
MHEYSLVESLVRRVEEEARRRGALRVHSLKVSVGELAGVDPGLFRTAYETFRQGTLCEETTLELVSCPAEWCCPSCGRALAPGAVLRCDPCGVAAKLTDRSDALLLESMDLEVP